MAIMQRAYLFVYLVKQLHYAHVVLGYQECVHFASSWHDGLVLYGSSSLPLISSPVTREVYACVLLFSMVHIPH